MADIIEILLLGAIHQLRKGPDGGEGWENLYILLLWGGGIKPIHT